MCQFGKSVFIRVTCGYWVTGSIRGKLKGRVMYGVRVLETDIFLEYNLAKLPLRRQVCKSHQPLCPREASICRHQREQEGGGGGFRL